LSWADEFAELEVHANVDTPERARMALSYGATGIGLCRTERMFNASDRLPLVIDMILATVKKSDSKRWKNYFRFSVMTLNKSLKPCHLTLSLCGCWIHRCMNSCPVSTNWKMKSILESL